MTDQRWEEAVERLARAVQWAGFPAEWAGVMARQLGSPRAIGRMTSYIYQARPRTEEMMVDEMLAICAEIDAWRERKAGLEAQARSAAYRRREAPADGGEAEDDESDLR